MEYRIKCAIIDDEPIAREGIGAYVAKIDCLNLIGSCKNIMDLTNLMQKNEIDLLFLDIQLPVVTGIDFVKNLKNPPMVIFTTAFPEYAIESYELEIVDYLLKPISYMRFYKAVLKAKELYQSRLEQVYTQNEFFFVKCNQKIEKIIINQIIYIESMSNYVIIYTKDKKIVSYLTLKSIEDQLPQGQFIKIHRSYIVALNAIKTIDGFDLIVENATLPISKNFKDDIQTIIDKYMFKR